MEILEFLRQFRLGGYAIFDFVVAFGGIYLISPRLTRLFQKIKIRVPKRNWLFLTLPISILIHLIVGSITPMTRDFINIYGNYTLKIVILILLILGLRGVRVRK
ncbi:MAG: hypothetical protein L3J07_02230 [Candidatus Magasanikbacteria bacterium]|nr:hypothetical protein [Candidatus Magasanikbacteria bacterium]